MSGRRKTDRRQNFLHAEQKKNAAVEMLAGKPIKQVAADWKISRSEAHRIFTDHLEYKIVWRT